MASTGRPVDEKIVKLTLESSDFEKNAENAVKTVANLDGGLGKLDKADLNKLNKAADNINSQFTIVGQTVQKLKNYISDQLAGALTSAADKMQNTFKNLTVGQVSAGWNKYTEYTNSLQTMMSASRSLIEDTSNAIKSEEDLQDYILSYLEQLNWFSDETSYGLTDMTSNIGKFVAAGVDLDTAVSAMQGIATWAASSGQNTQAAASAMYNFSQAMGKGFMSSTDWKSIENANMATKEFKELAVQTAMEVGTIRKETKKLNGEVMLTTATVNGNGKAWSGTYDEAVKGLRDTLQYQWMNQEVMSATLQKYGKFSEMAYEMQNRLGYDAVIELKKGLSEYEKMSDKISRENWVKDHIESMEELGMDQKQYNAYIQETVKGLDQMVSKDMELSRNAFVKAQETKTFGELIDATADAASTKWMKFFTIIFGNYTEATKLWSNLAEVAYEWFIEPLNALVDIAQEWVDLGGKVLLFGDEETEQMGSIQRIYESIVKIVGTLFKPIKKILGLGYDGENILMKITKFIDWISYVISDIANAIEHVSDIVEGVITGNSDLVHTAISGLLDDFGMLSVDIGNAFLNVVGYVISLAIIIVETIFNAVKNAFGLVGTEALKVLKPIYDFGKELFDPIIESGKKALDWINKNFFGVVDMLKGTWSELSGFAGGFFKGSTASVDVKANANVQAGDAPKEIEATASVLELFKSKEYSKAFKQLGKNIKSAFTGGAKAAKKYGKEISITEKLQNGFKKSVEAIKNLFKELGTTGQMQWKYIKDGFEEAKKDMTNFHPIKALGDIFNPMGTAIAKMFGYSQTANSLFDKLKNKVKEFYVTIKDTSIVKFFKNMVDGIKTHVDNLIAKLPKDNIFTDLFKDLWENIKSLGSIDLSSLESTLKTIKDYIDGITKSIKNWYDNLSTIEKAGFWGTLGSIAVVLGLVAQESSKINSNTGESKGFLGALTKFLDSTPTGAMNKMSGALSTFATSLKSVGKVVGVGLIFIGVLALAKALETLSQINIGALQKALFAVSEIMVVIWGISKLMGMINPAGLMATAGVFVAVGFGLNGMAEGIYKIASVDTKKFESAMNSITSLTVVLGIFSRVVDGSSILMAGVGLGVIAYSIKVLMDTAASIANVKPSVLETITGLVLGTLMEFIVMMAVAGNLKAGGARNLKALGESMLGLASVFAAIGAAVYLMKDVDVNLLFGIMTAVTAALGALIFLAQKGAVSIQIGITLKEIAMAMVIFATGVGIFAGAMYLLSTIAGQDLMKATNALWAMFAVFTAISGVLYFSAGAWLVFGTSLQAAGIGIGAAAAGIGIFVAAITYLLTVVSQLDNVQESFQRLVDALLIIAITSIPLIITFITSLITSLIVGLADAFVSIVDVLAEKIPQVVSGIIRLIVVVIDAVAQGILDNQESIRAAIIKLLGALTLLVIGLVGDLMRGALEAFEKWLGKTGMGIAGGLMIVFGIIAGMLGAWPLTLLGLAVGALFALWPWLKKEIGKFCDKIINGIKTFFGIHSPSTVFADIGTNLLKGLTKGFTDTLDSVLKGVKNIGNSVVNGFKKVFGIHSPSKVLYGIGDYCMQGLTNGFSDGTDSVLDSVEAMGEATIAALEDTAKDINDILDDNLNLNPVVTPVVDMGNITSMEDALNAVRKTGFNTSAFNSAPTTPGSGDVTIKNIDVGIEITAAPGQTVEDVAGVARKEAQAVIQAEVRKIIFQ